MPNKIKVAQHIFTSLTKNQVPQRRGGQQTLFYTHDQLTSADVRALEDRAQYRTAQGERIKWQFHWLPSRKAAISHFAPISEPDEFGRKGRYLIHSLIVSPSEWRLLDWSPFDLMNSAV